MSYRLMTALFGTILCAGTLSGANANFALEPQKKLIKFGWDAPTPAYLLKHLDEIENHMTPYDGMSIDLNSSTKKKAPPGSKWERAAGSASMMFGDWKWERSFFEREIAELKEANAKLKYLKHNFINTNSMAVIKDKFDWFDDEIWSVITNNFALMASIAKETGCKGLLLDIEHYERQTFLYNPAMKHSYADTWDKVRQRGREFITAITKAYPDITLFTFFWLDQNYVSADGVNSPYLKSEKWIMGLSLAFINGIYDVLPETATIVEGMEAAGYRANSRSDYETIAANRMKKSKWLIDPAHYDKYRRRTQLGIATYLDRYIHTDPKSVWFLSTDAKKNLERLKRNLGYALYFSDEYAWTWGEKRSWYPWKFTGWMKKACDAVKRPGPLWEDALPGITRGMIYAKDPHRYYREKIANNEFPRNLVRNPGFEDTSAAEVNGNLPSDCSFLKAARPWGYWQPASSKGHFTIEKDTGFNGSKAAKLTGVKSGTVLQGIQLEENGVYFLRAKAKTAGNANITLNIGWHDEKGRWNFWGSNVAVPFSGKTVNGWKEASFLLMKEQIPAGAKSFSVMLSVKGGESGQDQVLIDDVEVYNLNGK